MNLQSLTYTSKGRTLSNAGNMEFHSDSGQWPNDQKTSGLNTCLSPQAKQRKKLGSVLNIEKCERIYDDFHPQFLDNAEKSKGFHQKQPVERKFRKSEELVRYMSCLPSYLERGENPQEKPFNIGVLDWRLLQKWQHKTNDTIGINGEPSPSTSNSTFISSKGSSSYCSSDNAWSRHQQKIKYPSIPTEGCSSGTKLFAGNAGELVGRKNGSTDLLKAHHRSLQATQSSHLDTVNRPTYTKREERNLHKVTRTRLQPSETDGVIFVLNGNGMIQNEEASKDKQQVPHSAVIDRDLSERCKIAVPESRNNPGSRHFAVGHQSDSSKGDNNRLLEEDWYTFYGGCSEKASSTKSRSDHTSLYSIASERGETKDSNVDKSIAKEMRSLNCPSGKGQRTQSIESVSISPSRRKNLEKDSGSEPKNLAENEKFPTERGILESTNVRNPLPTRRFSFGMGRIGKSSNSNSSVTANLVSESIPHSEVPSISACSKYSGNDKSNAASRAKSSPLRRLLDPILKPKGNDSRDFTRSSIRNPLRKDRFLRSSSEQVESPASRSVEGTLDLNGSRTDDLAGPTNGTSSIHALLQIVVKNGLPLFTFTVDNCSDIIAATVKELNSNKTMRRWIYTFISFSETKKKNAHRINKGCKDKNQGYISNVIAQMMVSDSLDADSAGERYASDTSRREFVLSSVGARDVEQTSDSLPGDELAAIVVNLPERIGGQLNQDDQLRGTFNKQSVTGLQEPFPHLRNYSNLRKDEMTKSASDDIFGVTVILPGGHHGVSSKGEPSPLIERWKSGGSCDCGGWDIGCQTRILANRNQSDQRFNSTKSELSVFKLFYQEEERLMFVLSPFEDGIFSIDFNSSLKLIQAFAISIAVLHSRTSAVLPSNLFGGKMSEEITVAENSVSKIFNRAKVEVSAKYVANPPLSPVGRV